MSRRPMAMTLGVLGLMATVAIVLGSRNGILAVSLLAGACLLGLAFAPWVERQAGPVAAYALTVALRGGISLTGGAVVVAGGSDDREFWLWLVTAYLAALVTETVMATRPRGVKG